LIAAINDADDHQREIRSMSVKTFRPMSPRPKLLSRRLREIGMVIEIDMPTSMQERTEFLIVAQRRTLHRFGTIVSRLGL
jgi:hypothetical protein